MIEWGVLLGRSTPYWITVFTFLFIMAFFCAWTNDPAYKVFHQIIFKPLTRRMGHKVEEWSSILIGIIFPVFCTSCISSLLLTTHQLPTWRCNWFNKIVGAIRQHPSMSEQDLTSISLTRRFTAGLWFFVSSLRLPFKYMALDAVYGHDLASKKVNQFGRGEPNFNAISIGLVVLPITVGLLAYIPITIRFADENALAEGLNGTKLRLEAVSYLFGWASTLCLALFLIPVTRHSVLLASMGWSPIHALRIHIWSGYLSFVYMVIHGVILVSVWFIYEPYSISKQVIPHPKCWTWSWTENTVNEIQPNCRRVLANWTGIVAAVFYFVLWGSSLNWVRRKNYRLFYISHITFGTLTLLGTILHMYWFVIYFIPSITYYLASTTPTLVQAIASRFRGGVKIRKVVLVEDSGGCVEVHFEAHQNALTVLEREPCQFIKLCVPKISLIWHPFDVYTSYSIDGNSDNTVRLLFRPVGPFTKQLANLLTSDVERPVTLVDGFYIGADKVELAMQHDCLTIVAGGVALSSYLTLIPALLNRIAVAERSGGCVKTKSIVLHWACREPGLCHYYVENYLSAIVKRARFLNLDTTLAIYVYLTGSEKVTSNTTSDSCTKKIEACCLNDPENPLMNETAKADTDSFYQDLDGRDGLLIVDRNSSSPGHPLELARMLPRRYSNVLWNIPFFVFYSVTTFVGFWFLFSQTPDRLRDTWNYFEFTKMTWIVLTVIPMYFGFGILCESFVLSLRQYWPKPTPDVFDVVSANGRIPELSNSEDRHDTKLENGNLASSKVSLVYRKGRPSGDQIFANARTAVEPGIFMCGPNAMTSMVKLEASKENSYLGLTRYCLYDEPYEM